LTAVLVVMPDAGQVGFYSDWFNRGRGGPPRWGTLHLTEPRRLLERDWRAGNRRAGEDPHALWGDRQRQARGWAAHNPYGLAARLRGVMLFASIGSGQPGPLDTKAPTQEASQIEQAPQPENLAFVGRLRQLGIPVRFDAYGAGTRDWPYWQRELHRSLPMLQRALAVR
jgi:diacylglycerol O-acyltransferase / trehalose O-mycolyltransferase